MPARAAIYLDVNASAPLSEAALAEILSLLCEMRAEVPDYAPGTSARMHFGALNKLIPNPSSVHAEGRKAKGWLHRAREQMSRSLGAGIRPDELVLTSSGTEASQMAIRSVLEPLFLRGQKPHWILSAGDHDAHQQMKGWVKARGGTVSELPLDAMGAPQWRNLTSLVRDETALVSAIWVNNETGVITDIESLACACREAGAPNTQGAITLHLDAAQAWGKLPLNLANCGAQLVSFSGHKIGALAGTGVLWRARASLPKSQSPRFAHDPIFPGKQEGGARGGTENLLGAISLGAAAASLDPVAWHATVAPLRDRMERLILDTIPGAKVHGSGASRIANTSNLGFAGVDKAGLVAALDLAGFCVSSGSACSSGVTEPSQVLMAMGISPESARSAVRVSLPAQISWSDLEAFVMALRRAVERARQGAGAKQI